MLSHPGSTAPSHHEFDKMLGRSPVSLPVLGSTALKAREKCERSWLFSTVYGLRSVWRSKGRDEGSYLHHAAPILFLTPGNEARRVAAADSRLSVLQNDVLEDLAVLQDRDPADKDDPSVEQSHARAMGLAMAVRLYRELSPQIMTGQLRIVGAEMEFTTTADALCRSVGIPLDGIDPTIPVPIQVDLIVEVPSEGGVWLVDFKSEGESPMDAVAGYTYSVQSALYTAVVRLMRPDWRVRGFLHVVIRKPTIRRKGLSQGTPEPINDYIERCMDFWDGSGAHLSRRAELPGNPSVLVHSQPVSQFLLPSMYTRIADYLAIVSAYRSIPRSPESYPERESACRVGNMKCDFRALCTAPAAEWAGIASRRYTSKPDPLDSNPNRRDAAKRKPSASRNASKASR